jgi:hypothetical protein
MTKLILKEKNNIESQILKRIEQNININLVYDILIYIQSSNYDIVNFYKIIGNFATEMSQYHNRNKFIFTECDILSILNLFFEKTQNKKIFIEGLFYYCEYIKSNSDEFLINLKKNHIEYVKFIISFLIITIHVSIENNNKYNDIYYIINNNEINDSVIDQIIDCIF